jgi:hypothetical protein
MEGFDEPNNAGESSFVLLLRSSKLIDLMPVSGRAYLRADAVEPRGSNFGNGGGLKRSDSSEEPSPDSVVSAMSGRDAEPEVEATMLFEALTEESGEKADWERVKPLI